MPLSPPIIQTQSLTKQFGEITALNTLDLAIPEHSITGFLGPNGAGKSTTIKLLLGLMKPSSGSAHIFGMDISKNSTEIRQRVGYLAQNPQYYPSMTAREILRFTAKFFYSGPENLIDQRVDEMLGMVSLANKADRPIKGFSGGEKQRLGIAQAQINYPDLLILDEPAAALDPIGRQDVLQIMETLKDKTTIFYSTHILDDVQKVSDRVVILNQGELIAQGAIDELLKSSQGVVFDILIEGEPDKINPELRKQDWISSVSVEIKNDHKKIKVAVTDEETAKRALLPLLVRCKDITVLGFNLEKLELEDVFMQVVRGGNNEK